MGASILDQRVAQFRAIYGIKFGPAYCLASMNLRWTNQILHAHEMWMLRHMREHHRHVSAPHLQGLIRAVGLSGSVVFPHWLMRDPNR